MSPPRPWGSVGQDTVLADLSDSFKTLTDPPGVQWNDKQPVQASEGCYDMSTEPTTTAATGKHTTNGVPHGYTALTPFIVVDPAHEAIEFYREVFGATVLSVMPGAPREDGSATVSHAELDFGNGILQLSDPQPGYGLVAADAQHTNNSIAPIRRGRGCGLCPRARARCHRG